MYDASGTIYNPTIAYPYRPAIFNSLTAGLLGSLIPLSVIILSQLFLRSFADFSAAYLGLQYALATGTLFQLVLKKTIGGLRPHFLAVCKPRLVVPGSGFGYNGIMYRVQDVCTGTRSQIDWGIQSFPSGHSEIAFAGLGYLSIYLFTHLRLCDRSITTAFGFWRMVLVLMPILLATYISSTLWLSYHHHAFDCLFGAAIGIMAAILGYRTVYQSLTNGTLNAKPRVGRRLKKVIDEEEEKESFERRDNFMELGQWPGQGDDGTISIEGSLGEVNLAPASGSTAMRETSPRSRARVG